MRNASVAYFQKVKVKSAVWLKSVLNTRLLARSRQNLRHHLECSTWNQGLGELQTVLCPLMLIRDDTWAHMSKTMWFLQWMKRKDYNNLLQYFLKTFLYFLLYPSNCNQTLTRSVGIYIPRKLSQTVRASLPPSYRILESCGKEPERKS